MLISVIRCQKMLAAFKLQCLVHCVNAMFVMLRKYEVASVSQPQLAAAPANDHGPPPPEESSNESRSVSNQCSQNRELSALQLSYRAG